MSDLLQKTDALFQCYGSKGRHRTWHAVPACSLERQAPDHSCRTFRCVSQRLTTSNHYYTTATETTQSSCTGAKTSTMDLFKKALWHGPTPLYSPFWSVFLEADCLKTPHPHLLQLSTPAQIVKWRVWKGFVFINVSFMFTPCHNHKQPKITALPHSTKNVPRVYEQKL